MLSITTKKREVIVSITTKKKEVIVSITTKKKEVIVSITMKKKEVIVSITMKKKEVIVSITTKKKEVIVSRLFEMWIQYLRRPTELMSDNGGEFNNGLYFEVLEMMGIKIVMPSADTWTDIMP